MSLAVRIGFVVFSLGLIPAAYSCPVHGQQRAPSNETATLGPSLAASLPAAPQPQIQIAEVMSTQQTSADSAAAANPGGQSQTAQQPAADSGSAADASGSGVKSVAAQNCTDSQSSSQQPCQQKSRQQEAEEEVKEQEKQRVEGVIPTFNVTYRHNAAPLSPEQKMNIALRSAVDPFAFGSAFLEAGFHEAANDLKGFPWGPKGYFERSGVAYLDTFDGNILGTGVIPVIFHQDPRYFRLGYGSMKHRIFYSVAASFIAKSDKNGKWIPNYGNILGNLAAGELSNLYHPAGNSSTALAFSTTAIQILEGAGGSIFNEFWPDISRRYLHKDPTHGLDAQARTADAAKKLEKQKKQEKQNQN